MLDKISDDAKLCEEYKRRFDVKNIEQLPAVSAIEILLLAFYDKETAKPLSKKLIDRFNSFSAVINAPLKELTNIIGDASVAQFIRLLPSFSRYYLDDLNNSTRRIYDVESAYENMKTKFIGITHEAIAVMVLNSRGQIKYNGIICHGSMTMVPVYIRDIIGICIECEADTIILAHNHPSGNMMPSKGDLVATKEIQMGLEVINVSLEDHLIFYNDGYTSMKKSGWLTDLNKTIQDFRRGILQDAKEIEDKFFYV